MKTKKSEEELSGIAKRAVHTRRQRNPGGQNSHLGSVDVKDAFGRRKTFTSKQVMKAFGAATDNVTAAMAALRRSRLVEKIGLSPDGSSLWRWT